MRSSRITIALLLGALVGLALGVIVKGWIEEDKAPSFQNLREPVPEVTAGPLDGPIARAALDYAHALQENDWEGAIRRTWWMRARLERAEAAGEGREKARRGLVRDLSDRNPAGNRLRAGEIADQYLFPPGSRVEVLVVDEGEEGLEPAAAGRAWLRVTYARKDQAPLNAAGLPIRSLVVGVNVDSQGHVLKAGLSGNLSVDEGSISLDWE